MDGIERIAVLRAGSMGDLLLAVPVLHALSAAYPQAEITLFTSPGASALLNGREGAPDRIIELPLTLGTERQTIGRVGDDSIARLLAEQRPEGYDLVVQLGGPRMESVLRAVEARRTIGARAADEPALDHSVEYVSSQHETIRGLEVVGLVGAQPIELEPVLQPKPEELTAAQERFGRDRPIVAVHPGAVHAQRRWPVERFARLATELARDGLRIVVVGDEDERPLCRSIAFMASEAVAKGRSDLVLDTAGTLTVPDLIGLLGISRLMIGNDSGPRHLAQAIGTATASVYWFPDLISSGPLERRRHRVQIGWTTKCPVCNRDWARSDWSVPSCSHWSSYLADVPSDAVLEDARQLLGSPETTPA